jgi:3-methyladenine DNA glycosylase Tag
MTPFKTIRARTVRNPQKIMAVRTNARFVADIAEEHGSFGRFLAQWPADDQIGLLDMLAKRGARLGGHTGQYFLRFVGRDCFVISTDVVACLRDAGLDISDRPSSKRDLRKVQEQFNAWARETELPYTHLSRICALSIGENHDAETLRGYGGGEE